MQTGKRIALCTLLISTVFITGGCSVQINLTHTKPSMDVANESKFSTDGITHLDVSYDSGDVSFSESDSADIVVKEYMTENKSRYYAKVEQHNGSIKITSGERPKSDHDFQRRIEVYLPASYDQTLTVTTTSGDIELLNAKLSLSALGAATSSGDIELKKEVSASDIDLSSTSGDLDLGNIKANQIKLESTSGDITCSKLEGHAKCASTSGDTEIEAASGSGSYQTTSGELDVAYVKADGDLTLTSQSGDVSLTLPANLEFNFEGTTGSGTISAPFRKVDTGNRHIVKDVIGDNPSISVQVVTQSGDINVNQKA